MALLRHGKEKEKIKYSVSQPSFESVPFWL